MMNRTFELSSKLLRQNLKLVRDHFKRQKYFSEIRDDVNHWNNITHDIYTDHEPIFVLSTGRCGTELLTNILSTAKNLCCYHKPSPELLGFEPRVYHEGLSNFEAFDLALRMARFEIVLDCMIRNCRYVETSYRCTFFAHHLYKIFPNSKFIHLIRDPVSFIESGVRLGFYTTGLITDIGRITPLKGKYLEQWEDMDVYEKNAWLWNETNSFIDIFKSNVDSTRVLTVYSDDLFNNKSTIDILAKFGGFEFSNSARSKIKSMLSIKTNTKSSRSVVEKHSSWSNERKRNISKILTLADDYGFSNINE